MGDFSILSLNLRFGLADDGPNGWEFRRETVLRFFQRERPDFIAVQEANDFQTEYLTDHLPDYGALGKRDPAPPFWQDNILFYRHPIVCRESDHFFLSETPRFPSRSFGSRFPRQATLGLFEVQEKTLICINTHFDFETPAQLGACRAIKKQLAPFLQDTPVVLAGDFNATPGSACYRWLTDASADDKAGLDLKETFTEPYPSTFHRFTGKPVAGYIDWILFRGLLRLKKCRVLDGMLDGNYLSDHFPVTAEFSF